MITGDMTNTDIIIPDYMTLPGMVNDIGKFLRTVKAIAILSPLGYGFKTSIADALANESHVLLHSLHYSRSPEIVKDVCIEVSSISTTAVTQALDQLEKPFPCLAVNDFFQNISLSILERDFGNLTRTVVFAEA
jgi:hypothetical protein